MSHLEETLRDRVEQTIHDTFGQLIEAQTEEFIRETVRRHPDIQEAFAELVKASVQRALRELNGGGDDAKKE